MFIVFDMTSVLCIHLLPFTTQSLGCWTDNAADRVLSLQTAPNCPDGETAMSPQICADYCATIPGAEIFGVEFYFQVTVCCSICVWPANKLTSLFTSTTAVAVLKYKNDEVAVERVVKEPFVVGTRVRLEYNKKKLILKGN